MPYVKIQKKKLLKNRRKKFNRFIPREVKYVDYKNTELLSHFVNTHGKIIPAAVSGLNANQQRAVTVAIKRARFMSLMSYTIDRIRK